MRRHIGIILTLVLFCAVGARAQEQSSAAKPPAVAAAPSELVLLSARIKQLEIQLDAEQRKNAVLTGRLAISEQPQARQDIAKQLAALDKAAGCALDWIANPPACKPASAAPGAKPADKPAPPAK